MNEVYTIIYSIWNENIYIRLMGYDNEQQYLLINSIQNSGRCICSIAFSVWVYKHFNFLCWWIYRYFKVI